MDNQQATSGWFVGMLEGEGCFIAERCNEHLRKYSSKAAHKQQCQVRISNTEMDVILACKAFLDKRFVRSYILTSKRGKNKPLHELYISGTQECKILHSIVKDQMDCRHDELEQILGASTTTRETTSDKEWLYGIYEAEGCFTISTHTHKGDSVSHNPEIILENTNFRIIDKVAKTLHSVHLTWYIRDRTFTNPAYKPSRIIKISGFKRVCNFLRLVGHGWIGRKTIRKVKLLEEFCHSRLQKDQNERYSEREHQIAHEIKTKSVI